MNILRFITKMNASELASWVQAVGSITTIITAFFVVRYQVATQRKEDIRKEERRVAVRQVRVLRFAQLAIGTVIQFCEHLEASVVVVLVSEEIVAIAKTYDFEFLKSPFRDLKSDEWPEEVKPEDIVEALYLIDSTRAFATEWIPFCRDVNKRTCDWYKPTEVKLALDNISERLGDIIKRLESGSLTR
jgi:hypothetical protein